MKFCPHGVMCTPKFGLFAMNRRCRECDAKSRSERDLEQALLGRGLIRYYYDDHEQQRPSIATIVKRFPAAEGEDAFVDESGRKGESSRPPPPTRAHSCPLAPTRAHSCLPIRHSSSDSGQVH